MNKASLLTPFQSLFRGHNHIFIFLCSLIYILPVSLCFILLIRITNSALAYLAVLYFLILTGGFISSLFPSDYKQTLSYALFYISGVCSGILLSMSSTKPVLSSLFFVCSLLPIISLYLVHKLKPNLLKVPL